MRCRKSNGKFFKKNEVGFKLETLIQLLTEGIEAEIRELFWVATPLKLVLVISQNPEIMVFFVQSYQATVKRALKSNIWLNYRRKKVK